LNARQTQTPTAVTKRNRLAWIIVSILLSAAVSMTGTGSEAAHAADGHPAKIHEGTCDALGPVAFSLTGVGASVDLDENPIATPQPVNADSAFEVATSQTTIDTSLDALLSGDHAIMLYEDDEGMAAIACGNLGGAMLGDTLVVGLGEAGMPGHVGFAILTPNGDKTDVTLLLGEDLTPLSAAGEEGHEHEEQDESEMATPSS
jgi:hypothetical protein